MRTRIVIGVAATSVALVALAFSAVAAHRRAPIRSPETLRFAQQTTAVFQNDVGPPGTSIGDQVTSYSNVRKHGTVVGHTGGTCTLTGRQAICTGVIRLDGGQIAVVGQLPAGFLSGTGTARLAVTGGTGAYQQVSGFATIEQSGAPTQELTLYLQP